MAYGDFKDLTRRIASDNNSMIKHLMLLKIRDMIDVNADLLQWFINSLIKKSSGRDIKTENVSNKKLAEELHKPITRKFKKRKVHSSFIDNIWRDDLADMQLISKFNKGIRFLLCVIDIFSKYAWIIPLKDKKDTIITNAFQKILNLITNQTKYG